MLYNQKWQAVIVKQVDAVYMEEVEETPGAEK